MNNIKDFQPEYKQWIDVKFKDTETYGRYLGKIITPDGEEYGVVEHAKDLNTVKFTHWTKLD